MKDSMIQPPSKSISPPLPPMIELEITIRCNLRCVMCTQPFWSEAVADMPWERFVSIVDNLALDGRYAPRVELHGVGESLLHRDLFRMVGYLRERGPTVQLTSNFTLFDERAADKLLQLGINGVRASIDGGTRETYEGIRVGAKFDRVIANARGFAAKRLTISPRPSFIINSVISRRNVMEIPLLVDLAADMAVDECQLINVISNDPSERADLVDPAVAEAVRDGIARAAARNLRLSFKYFDPPAIAALGGSHCYIIESPAACRFPFETAYVTYEGFLFPCFGGITSMVRQAERLDRLRDQLVGVARQYGNLAETPITELWQSAEYRALRSELLADRRTPLCVSCAYLPEERTTWASS
jgi:MoaA/NifB/PqqE/SkfB family radical SAM enzyme